jgi:hypothetical protein
VAVESSDGAAQSPPRGSSRAAPFAVMASTVKYLGRITLYEPICLLLTPIE